MYGDGARWNLFTFTGRRWKVEKRRISLWDTLLNSTFQNQNSFVSGDAAEDQQFFFIPKGSPSQGKTQTSTIPLPCWNWGQGEEGLTFPRSQKAHKHVKDSIKAWSHRFRFGVWGHCPVASRPFQPFPERQIGIQRLLPSFQTFQEIRKEYNAERLINLSPRLEIFEFCHIKFSFIEIGISFSLKNLGSLPNPIQAGASVVMESRKGVWHFVVLEWSDHRCDGCAHAQLPLKTKNYGEIERTKKVESLQKLYEPFVSEYAKSLYG